MPDLNVNLNQIDLSQFEITWTPNQGEEGVSGTDQAAGNYGTVVDVVFEQNKISITTDKGLLVLTGPELPEPGTEIDPQGIDDLSSHLPTSGQMTDLYAILALMHEVAKVGRQSMREMAKAQAEGVYSLNMKAAGDIRSAATLAFVGAIVSGACSIASGMISLRQAGNMLSMSKQINTTQGSTDAEVAQIKAQNSQVDAKINATQLKGQGQAAITQGVGTMGKGLFDYLSQQESAEQKEHEAQAAQQDSLRQQTKDDQDNYGKLVDSVRDTLQQINQSYEQSLKQIWS